MGFPKGKRHVADTVVVVKTPLAWACGSVCGSTVHPRKGNERGCCATRFEKHMENRKPNC